jgi:hypothetical protein
MSGNKGPMKKPNGKPTPKALALRRWNCESVEQMAQMITEGEQLIAEIKKGQKDSNGFTKCWPGKHAEGTKKGKNGGQVRNCVPNESVAESSGKRCQQCGMTDCKCKPGTCKCKPIAGWIPNKGFKKAMDEAALSEKWTQKYKSSINCASPKGFSQKAHCAGKKK